MHSIAEGDISVDEEALVFAEDGAGRTALNLTEEKGSEHAIKALNSEQLTGYNAWSSAVTLSLSTFPSSCHKALYVSL